MKVWGFTILKNGVTYDYPFLESIQSILPICDKVIVRHGDSDDNTRALLDQLDSEKVIIVQSTWDQSIRTGGSLLAIETDAAYRDIPDDTDWCIYIQADEVFHESDYASIRTAMEKYCHDSSVDGLLFDYLHFYGSYGYYASSSDWYKKEVRIIRKDPSFYSYRDAQGFRKGKNQKLWVKSTNARVFHYGWVKHPATMQKKVRDFHSLWHSDKWIEKNVNSNEHFDFQAVDMLTLFEETHPVVMQKRIDSQHWEFDYDISSNKRSLKERLKGIGKRLFGKSTGDYQNYRIRD